MAQESPAGVREVAVDSETITRWIIALYSEFDYVDQIPSTFGMLANIIVKSSRLPTYSSSIYDKTTI